MPYSLRTKLKHLACERDITVKECERLIKALDALDAVEEIKAECVRAVDRIPITFSKQDADNCLKKDIRDIFDKHIGKEQEK